MNLYMYLGDNEIYCIFKDILHNLCFLFPPKNSVYFINLTFSVQIIHFFKYKSKFQHPPQQDRG